MPSISHTLFVLRLRWILAPVLASFCCAAPSRCGAARAQPAPDCGVASVYAALRILGRDLSLGDIEDRFRELVGRDDLSRLSLAEMRSVAESYGLHAASFTGGDRLEDIAVPAILYLRAQRLDRSAGQPGHFIVLRAADNDQADIVDLSLSLQSRLVPAEKLREAWDGQFLVIAEEPISVRPSWRNVLSIFLIIAGAAAACSLVRRRKPLRETH